MAAKPARTPEPKPTAPARAYPRTSVIERRIATGAPNQGKAFNVKLKNQPEPMIVRTINAGIPGRWYQAINDLGWVPVLPEEIAGGLHGDLRTVDGNVVIGESGKEILVKMPERDYNAIQKAKQTRLDREQKSRTAFQKRVVSSLERDAKGADRQGAEALERQAEASEAFDLQEFNVTKERVPMERE